MAKSAVYKSTKSWAKKNGTLGSGRDLAERHAEIAKRQKTGAKKRSTKK